MTVGKAWDVLRRTVRDLADGYASTDPRRAYLYRQEAGDFCAAAEPHDFDALRARGDAAERLRERWAGRLTRRAES